MFISRRCLQLALALGAASRLGAQSPIPQASPPQQQPPAERLQRAAALFAQRDWVAALDAYSELAKGYPGHALSRFRVGVSLVELGRFAEGETSLREGERLGMPAGQSAYRLAQSLSEQRRADEAIRELRRSAQAGMFLTPAAIASDRHLARLKAHAEWPGVLDAFDAIVRPCAHDPRYREFDFWVGDWDVRPTGQAASGPPARNIITRDDDGCVLTEHWQAPSGSEGQSFNIFDRSYGVWRQTWVDNTGGQHDYRGALKDGNMVYLGDTPALGGRPGRVPTRLTFFRLGTDSVRQFSEISTDSGRTWQVNYDLTYVRRTNSAPRPGEALTDADRAAIRALDSAFVRAWLRDDTVTVLSVFSSDALLFPPGSPPVSGLAAIRSYWWPRDGTTTRITSFERTIDEISGGRSVAYLRGSARLRWNYTKHGTTTAQSSRSLDLFILEPDAAGRWRIVRSMWQQVK